MGMSSEKNPENKFGRPGPKLTATKAYLPRFFVVVKCLLYKDSNFSLLLCLINNCTFDDILTCC